VTVAAVDATTTPAVRPACHRQDCCSAFSPMPSGRQRNLSNSGSTALRTAREHPGTVRALLDRGADTARINDRGQTALAAAVFRRSVESVTQLLVAGADPALGPRSALDVAHVFELPEMLALLTR
jgi:ankyrin repeat protein